LTIVITNDVLVSQLPVTSSEWL